MTYYCTLNDARRELGTATANATEDPTLLQMIRIASSRLDSLIEHTFEPVKMTEYLPIRADRIRTDLRLFLLPRYALELSAVTPYNTSLTIGTNVRGWPNSQTPFIWMQLISTSGDWYSTYYDSNYDPLVTTTAIYGYHNNYAYAWHTSDTIQDALGITATATSITVTDADGVDWRLETPRFQAGQLLKIETEYLRVTAVNTTTNVLTVQRGVNGSTAAIHAKSTAIYIWYPIDDIRQAVARQAAALYKRRGAFETPNQFGVGSGYPLDLLADLRGVIQEYMYVG